jgi:aminoglycoside phosphotransferase (APT) family kinase protein/SAM-dependent methyltransferase
MRQLLCDTRSLGWDQTYCDLLGQADPQEMQDMTGDLQTETNAAWRYGVSVKPDAVVLDFDCGWGPVSLNLARLVRLIYSTDRTHGRLALLRERAAQRGLGNVRCVQAGDSWRLPFPDQFFDLVCIRRGLEATLRSLGGDPDLSLPHLLAEFRRVLKPAGQLFTCAHNRLARRYFLGGTDEQSPLRYATLMPRPLANLYCRLRGVRSQHAYLRTLPGLRRLFQQAGFRDLHVDALLYGIPNFSRVVPLGDLGELSSWSSPASWGRRLAKWLFINSGAQSLLAPAFGLVASPTAGARGMLDRLLKQICLTHQADYRAVRMELRYWSSVFILLLEDKHRPDRAAVLKVGVHEPVSEGLRRAAHNVRTIAPTLGRPRLVPRVLEEGVFEGSAYVLEERLPGRNGAQLFQHGSSPRRLLGGAWDLFEEWMRSTRRVVHFDEPTFYEWINYQPERCRSVYGRRTAEALAEVVNTLGEHVIGTERTVVASHNDCQPANLLFDEATGEMTGLLDWETASLLGNPLVDAMALTYSQRTTPFAPRDGEDRSVDSLVDWLNRGLEEWGDDRLLRLRSEYGLGDVDAAAALLRTFLTGGNPPYGEYLRPGAGKWVEALRIITARAVDGLR